MTWPIFSALYSITVHSILDFVFFIFVDVVAKAVLKDAVNDEEKRRIWLFESMVLSGLSLLVYLFDHNPVVLITLTVITLFYTQLHGRIDFRYWWNLIRTRWEEAQQHEESMNQRKRHQSQQQKTPPGTPVLRTIPHPAYYPTVPSTGGGGFPPNVTVSPGLDRNTFIVSHNQGLSPHSDQFSRKQNELPNYCSKFYDAGVLVNNHLKSGMTPARNRGGLLELKRRPLRNEFNQNNNILSKIPQIQSSGTTLKTKVLSALGIGSNSNSIPPGIRNNGHNLCFMNSIIQCLARSPHLVKCLSVEAAKEMECNVTESMLLTSFMELLHQCKSSSGSHNALDPSAFRQSAATLNPQLITQPGQRQTQQDAAEFLTWILDTLHNILNKNRKALQADKQQQQCNGERFTSNNLLMLKKIYGDLNKKRIHDLMKACRREIELANGLENDSYAEPIQRLSDLEWLTHKHDNESSVDDLFKGQLVEAYHCLQDNHISVHMQAFNILPVPIVQPHVNSGLVMLNDCFTSLCHVEHLMDQDNLQCSLCTGESKNSVKKSQSITTRTRSQELIDTPHNILRNRADSAFHSPSSSQMMSPIIGIRDIVNDSGYYDNVFKTSTPILDGGTSNDIKQTKTKQRRCLLRQLPECLTIQLLRFSYNPRSGRSKKVKAPLCIPVKGLDLSSIIYDIVTDRQDMTASSGSHIYDLYGMCLHLGSESTNNGHYISYCLCDDNTWYRFDDEDVCPVNINDEVNTREVRENVYILFYKQTDC